MRTKGRCEVFFTRLLILVYNRLRYSLEGQGDKIMGNTDNAELLDIDFKESIPVFKTSHDIENRKILN